MVFTERGVVAGMPAEDVICWEREKKRTSVEHFINYCFFLISDYICIFQTCSAFFYSTAQMLK